MVRTAISLGGTDIGQLAATVVIRTFLNHFLEKDLEQYEPAETLSEMAQTAKAGT